MELLEHMNLLLAQAKDVLIGMGCDKASITTDVGARSYAEPQFWISGRYRGTIYGAYGKTFDEALEKATRELHAVKIKEVEAASAAKALAESVMDWWADANDGQVVPNFVQEAERIIDSAGQAQGTTGDYDERDQT